MILTRSWRDLQRSNIVRGLLFFAILAAVYHAFPQPRPWLKLAWNRIASPARDLPATPTKTEELRRPTLVNTTLPSLSEPRVVIYKSKRRAELYSGDRLIKQYKIALGGQPNGPKQRRYDQKTPEGTFYICTRLDRSKFHLFLGVNYPRAGDAKRGMAAKLINEAEGQAIIQAEQQKSAPNCFTNLGGAIGLHGGGTDLDWTNGCIAFENRDIEEIWAATRHWTPVEIRP